MRVEPVILSREQDPMSGGEVIRVKRGRDVFIAVISLYEVAEGDERWHVSVSRERDAGTSRVPSWASFRDVVHCVAPPDVYMAIPMPPASAWMNITECVLHCQEVRDPALIGQWRAQGEAASGTPAGVPT